MNRADEMIKRAAEIGASANGKPPDPAPTGLVVEQWSRFRDVSESEHVEYVVDGVAQAAGVGFIAAAPKNGKSWQALHMAVAIATGKPYAGRYDTNQRNVVYLALEGARANLRARVGCLARGLGVDPDRGELDRLHVIYKPRRIDLHDQESAAGVVEAVSDIEPGVMFVDVLRRAARIRESGEGVADFTHTLENLDPLTSAGWTIILLHHFKKWSDNAGGDTGDRMSGSGSLFGHADFAIFIVKADRENRRYDLEFVSRDGPQLPDLTVRIQGDGSGPHGGLTYHDTALVVSESDEDAPARRVASIDHSILSWVGKHPGQPQRTVLKGAGGNTQEAATRLAALVLTGRIVVHPGPRNAKLHYLPEAFPEYSETVGNGGPGVTVSAFPSPLGGNAGNAPFPPSQKQSSRPGPAPPLEDGGW